MPNFGKNTNKLQMNVQFFAWEDVMKEDGSNNEKVPFTSFDPNSKTVIRVLENEPYTRWVHWMNTHKRSVTCLGAGCPICAIVKTDKANGLPARYTNSKKHCIKIYNYSTKQVEILEAGKNLFSDLYGIYEAYGSLTGLDLTVRRTGKGTDTTYQILPNPPAEMTEEVKQASEAITYDYKERLKPYDKNIIMAVLAGQSFEEAFKMNEVTVENDPDLPFDM